MEERKIEVVEIVHAPKGGKTLKIGELVSVTRLMYKATLMKDGVRLPGVVDGGLYIFKPA